MQTGVSTVNQEVHEFLGTSKDGRDVPLELTTSLMEFESDDYVIVVLRDISARRDSERALQESEARTRLIESNITDVIFITDLEFKLLYVSPTIFFQTGFTSEEVVGKSLAEMITPESFAATMERRAEELLKAAETHVTPPIPVELNVDQVRKDGSTFPSEVRAGFLRRPDGTPYGALGITRDITERVRLEEVERANAAITASAEVSEKYAAELKDIITVAAHELRMPATVFKGYSRILLDYRDKLEDGIVEKALKEINAASTRLNDLVGNLLDTSLIDQSKVSLDLKPILPSALVSLSLDGVGPWVYNGRLSIRAPEEEDHIVVDNEKMARVILILIDNALKYSPAEAEVDIWFDQDDRETVFSVRDRGPGIPEKDREKVFDRFYQVEEVKHHSLPGLGLGLYIARSTVELHEGWINVEQAEGGGSLFRFGLPR